MIGGAQQRTKELGNVIWARPMENEIEALASFGFF